jgi:hypothetical protein
MDIKKITEMLSAPFEDNDLEWRLQWINSEHTKGSAVPYVTNRAIQNRLDTVVGIDNWKNEYAPWHSDGKKASQLCGIFIWIAERGEWLAKYDGAEDSDIESVKGGLSDSMKRAAVQWGIGRYLYSMSTEFVKIDNSGKTPKIMQEEYAKLNAAHQKIIAKLFNTKTPDKPKKQQTKPPQQQEETPFVDEQEDDTPFRDPKPVPASQKRSPTPSVPVLLKPEPASSAAKPVPQNTLGKAVHGVFTVLKVVKVASLKRSEGDMNVLLQDSAGKSMQVYCRGYDPAFIPGINLANCKITKRMNGDIVFYILEEYVIVDSEAA